MPKLPSIETDATIFSLGLKLNPKTVALCPGRNTASAYRPIKSIPTNMEPSENPTPTKGPYDFGENATHLGSFEGIVSRVSG
jgi:hypothetical protein